MKTRTILTLRWRHSLLLLVVFLVSPSIKAQKQATHWFFGDSCYVHFSDTGIVVGKGPFYTHEASSSLNDKNGNLLIYGNSEYFYNANHDKVFKNPVGDHSSTQGLTFFWGESDSAFHFVSMEDLTHRIPNRTLFGTMSSKDFTVKDTQVILDASAQSLACVNHQNNRDVWFMVHTNNTSEFMCFLVKHDRLVCCPSISHGQIFKLQTGSGGQFVFAPNGKYFFSPASGELGLFNNHTGKIDSIRHKTSRWGAAFSPDSKLLFINGLYLTSYPMDSFYSLPVYSYLKALSDEYEGGDGSIQYGPDGKIYVAHFDSSKLGVIENPDAPWGENKYDPSGLRLAKGTRCQRGLPNFNASYFHKPNADFSYREDCRTNTYQFEGYHHKGWAVFNWRIKDLSTGREEFLSGKNISYTFKNDSELENPYEIRLITILNNILDTSTKVLTIRPKFDNTFLGNDTFFCQGDSLVLRMPQKMHCVHWMGQEPNQDRRIGPLVPYSEFKSDSLIVYDSGLYFVRATNLAICQEEDSILVSIKPNPELGSLGLANDTLVSLTKAHAYRWYRDGAEIALSSVSHFVPHGNGYYQVQLVSEFGCESPLSERFLVDWVGSEELEIPGFKLFPNPNSEVITIEKSDQREYFVEIFNQKGKIIRSQKVDKTVTTIFLDGFAAGTYFLKFTDQQTGRFSAKKIQVKGKP